jgi:hypothetical protein
MTPKEKANELVDKMYSADNGNNEKFNPFGGYMDKPIAKQCALIAVDELMNVGLIRSRQQNPDKHTQDYWKLVKQEIEKL